MQMYSEHKGTSWVPFYPQKKKETLGFNTKTLGKHLCIATQSRKFKRIPKAECNGNWRAHLHLAQKTHTYGFHPRMAGVTS